MAIFNEDYLIEAGYADKNKKKKKDKGILDKIKFIIECIAFAIKLIPMLFSAKRDLSEYDKKSEKDAKKIKAELDKHPKAKTLLIKGAKELQNLLKSEIDSKYISYNSISENDIKVGSYPEINKNNKEKISNSNYIYCEIASFNANSFLKDSSGEAGKMEFDDWYDLNKEFIKNEYDPIVEAINDINKSKSEIKNGSLFKVSNLEKHIDSWIFDYNTFGISMIFCFKNIEDVDQLKEQHTNRDFSAILEYSYRYNSHDGDDEEDNEMSYKAATKHLSNSEVRRAREAIQSVINKYPKIKKSANQVDLYDNSGEMDDDGKYSSPMEIYNSKKPGSYFKLIDGDLLSGYPNFKSGGSEDYSDDLEDMKKEINSKFKSLSIPAVFTVGSDGDEEDISYGIRSIKK